MICARILNFYPHTQALRAIPVVQELRDATAEVRELLAEIGLRFKAGDAAEELLIRLEQRLAALVSQMSSTAELPLEMRDEITELLSRVHEAVAAGTEWLDATGPELASQNTQVRLRRTYGVP